ncbi:unnamed protein product, partial [Fusarium graminearum]
ELSIHQSIDTAQEHKQLSQPHLGFLLLYNLNKSPLIQISSRQSIVEVIMAATNNPSADINLSKDDPKPKPPWPTDPILRYRLVMVMSLDISRRVEYRESNFRILCLTLRGLHRCTVLRSCGEARRKSVRIGERNKENRNAYASGSNLENGRVA